MTDEIKIKAIEWLLGGDTGISSKTMCGAVFGIKPSWYDMPHDAYDFGRCLRFIRFMPAGIKDIIFKNLADKPEWSAIQKEWDNLTDLYDKKEWNSIYNILSDIRKKFRKPKSNEIFFNIGGDNDK